MNHDTAYKFMQTKLIYEKKQINDQEIQDLKKLFCLPTNHIIDLNDAENYIKQYTTDSICQLALSILPSVFNNYSWKEITYFSDFAQKILNGVANRSILICPGCSPSKIVWLLNNVFKITDNYYRCPNGSIKELTIIQFPLSDLFTNSSIYDQDKVNQINMSKLDDYIKTIFEPYINNINEFTPIYYIDAIISGRTYKLLSESILKLGIKQLIQSISIIPNNNLEKVYIIRSFCGSDSDRIIEKYNVFTGQRFGFWHYYGNLSLLVFYIAYKNPSIAQQQIKCQEVPKLIPGKVYEVDYGKGEIDKLKVTAAINNYYDCVFYNSDWGFFIGYMQISVIQKLYECESNIDIENYKDKNVNYQGKIIEGNKLIKDNLLDFALAIGYAA